MSVTGTRVHAWRDLLLLPSSLSSLLSQGRLSQIKRWVVRNVGPPRHSGSGLVGRV